MSRISSLFTPVSTVPSDVPRSPALPTRPGSRSGSHNTFDNNMDDLMLLDDVRPSPTCDTPLSRTPTRQIVTPVSSMCHPQADGYRRAISMLSLPSMKCATPQESLTKGSSPHGRHRVMCDSPIISPAQYSSVDSISKAVPPSYYNHCQVGVPETVSKWQDEAARLNALVCSLQQELHRESCKHQQERDTLEWNNEILNKKIENLRQQSDLESKNLEHKVANLTEQNRMQGEQVLQLGRSMSSLRMENQRLEMELLRVRPADSYPLVDRYGSDSHSDSVSRRAHEEALATAQARTVELAKKLLECERGKTAAEEALIAVHKRGMSDDSNNNNCRDSSSRERATSEVVGVVGCMGPTQDTSITELQTRLAASEKRAAYLYNINNNRQAELQALQDNYVSEKKRRTRDLINIRHALKKVSSELLVSQEHLSELYIERDKAIYIIQTLGSMYKDIYSNSDNNNNSLLNKINDFLNNISLNNNIRNNNISNNNISSISSNSKSQDKWMSTANRDNNITMFDNIIHNLRNNNNNNNSDYDSDIYIDTPIRVHSSDRDADGDDGGLGDNNNNNINNSINNNNNNNNNNYVTKLEDSVITANEKETVYKEHIGILNNHIEYLERQLNTNKPEMWGLYNSNNNINNSNNNNNNNNNTSGINRRNSDVDLVSSLNISSGDYCNTNNNNNEYNMVSP